MTKHKDEVLKFPEEHHHQSMLNDKCHSQELASINNNHSKHISLLEHQHSQATAKLKKQLEV